MKKLLGALVLCIVLNAPSALSQALQPVHWSFSAKKISATDYEIRLSARIDEPWHIYSQNLPEGGPIPTQVSFAKNPMIILQGKTTESGKAQRQHEEVFNMDVVFYSKSVTFIQKVKKKASVKTNLTGNIRYMVCKEGECLPVTDQSFSINLE